MPTFDSTLFDVATILKSRTLMGEYRGREIWSQLQEKLTGLNDHRTLVIDMTSALILDYDFSSFAFAPLFGDTSLEEARRFVFFQIASTDRNAFFHGVLKALGHRVGDYSDSLRAFVDNKHVCKLVASRAGPISFIGAIAPLAQKLLDAINQMGSADIATLASYLRTSHEDIHDSLRELTHKGFVVDIADTGHKYYSFNNHLCKEA